MMQLLFLILFIPLPTPLRPTSLPYKLNFVTFCLFIHPPSAICASQIFLDMWPFGEALSTYLDHTLKENWHSLPQQLSLAYSSLARSKISCLPLFAILGFCLAWFPWGCAYCHNCCEFIRAAAKLCPEHAISLDSFNNSGSYSLLSFFQNDPWAPGRGSVVEMPHLWMSITRSLILYILTCWGALC